MDANEFKEMIGKLGYSKQMVADILGVTLRSVYNYESGKREVPRHVGIIFQRILADREFEKKLHRGA